MELLVLVARVIVNGRKLHRGVRETISNQDRLEVDFDGAASCLAALFNRLQGVVLLPDVVGKVRDVGACVRLAGDVEGELAVLGELLEEKLHERIVVLCGLGGVVDDTVVAPAIANPRRRLVEEDHISVVVPGVLVVLGRVLVDDGARAELEKETSCAAAAGTTVEPRNKRVLGRVSARLKEGKEEMAGLADVQVTRDGVNVILAELALALLERVELLRGSLLLVSDAESVLGEVRVDELGVLHSVDEYLAGVQPAVCIRLEVVKLLLGGVEELLKALFAVGEQTLQAGQGRVGGSLDFVDDFVSRGGEELIDRFDVNATEIGTAERGELASGGGCLVPDHVPECIVVDDLCVVASSHGGRGEGARGEEVECGGADCHRRGGCEIRGAAHIGRDRFG